ncbi:MAG TPA: acyl-CoA dehydrogenase family protein [Acidimicrobiales bacterium]|nr:acyl-CoA dehydrogenase family protein [Acidimicrobiales bacterium]
MQLDLTSDQEFFRDTTARYLDERAPVGELRRLRDDPAGYDEKFWTGGAELGWTSLLVDEAHGGGTISGDGLVDLTLVAYEFGRHAAPGPLIPTNLVAAALSATGAAGDVLADLLAGDAVASWVAPGGQTRIDVRADGDDVVVDGVARPAESAAEATHVLVGADDDTHVLVPTDAPGVTVEPMSTVDLTRRFSLVRFDGVRLPASSLLRGVDVERQLQVAAVLACAESVGAMQAGFDMTVEWAFDRYSFGRPLASYQEIKHRFADMKTWLEASHAISDAAAVAVSRRSHDAAQLVSAAKAYVGEFGTELLQDCVQIHGGIGVTYEHDLHLYLRRHTVDRSLYGTPSDHRQRIADLVEQEEARQ